MIPYPIPWRLLAALALAGAMLAAGLYVRALRAEAASAATDAALARASLAAVEANARLSVKLLERHARLAHERAERVADLEEVIRRARQPLPKICDRALDPVRDAVDGIRVLRAVPGAATHGPAPAAVP